MVQLILTISLFISSFAYGNIFSFTEGEGFQSKVPGHIEKLRKLEMENLSDFESNFNNEVRNFENSIEQEKLFCAGESADPQGRVLPKEQKQLCYRELKKHYLGATEVIFELKKKYLELIHNRQIEKLTEVQKTLKSDIEKSF